MGLVLEAAVRPQEIDAVVRPHEVAARVTPFRWLVVDRETGYHLALRRTREEAETECARLLRNGPSPEQAADLAELRSGLAA